MIAPTVDGRTFKAIRIAGYKDVAVKDGKITGFDLTLADGVTDSALTTAILAGLPSGVESVFTVTDGKITPARRIREHDADSIHRTVFSTVTAVTCMATRTRAPRQCANWPTR
ncbi:hypothetical protein BP20092_08190 [Bifidobacterium pseudolongum subsp. globosum DSM 20092]|nr:hypothetical protein BP20092_08190 [Bifidobacterium pseudolongum subsp. globosum DSM 20092]